MVVADHLAGGTGNHLAAVLRQWDRSRFVPEVVCQGELLSPLDPAIRLTTTPPPKRFDRYPVTQIQQFLQLRREVARRAPSVLHAYFFWPIIYGRLLKQLGLIRHLVESREDQGFNWGRHEYLLLAMTRSVPDRIVCVSDAVREVVLEREGPDPSRVTVIRNGIALPVPEASPADRAQVRREFGLADEHLIVGMVANLNRSVKGVPYFVDSVPQILEAVPEARFLIVGGGRDEPALREQARRLGVGERIVFTGYRTDLHRLYPIIDLSVLTSLSEGLSITLLESMAHGRAVVATRVGGNPEIVRHGETGFLVPARDVSAFAARVVQLLRDARERVQMGERGRQVVREHFDLRTVATSYLDVYERVLRGRGSR